MGVARIVTPDTLLGWCRNLVAWKYDGSRHRGPGRPPTQTAPAELGIRMACSNPGWGYTRVRGALRNLAWMEQVARNLTDAVDGFLKTTRYLIHDRDPLFTKAFTEILRVAGVKTVKLPARSPT
jgi:hypothetical protein